MLVLGGVSSVSSVSSTFGLNSVGPGIFLPDD